MLEKAAGYGYKKVGFILDRGYFSRGNMKSLDSHGYSFIIMVKGMNDLVDSLILKNKGTFENKWARHIDEFDVYGTTVKRKMYEGDEKERYFHLYYSSTKEGNELNKYRMDHAVTATQKVILKAFGMDANLIKHYAAEIGEILKEAK